MLNFFHLVHTASPHQPITICTEAVKSRSSLSKAERTTNHENFTLKLHQTLGTAHVYPDSPKCHTPTISPGVNTASNELQRRSTSQLNSTCASPCPGRPAGRAALARASPGDQAESAQSHCIGSTLLFSSTASHALSRYQKTVFSIRWPCQLQAHAALCSY